MKRVYTLLAIALLGLTVSACSDDQAASAPAKETSNSLSISAEDGSFSFQKEEGGEKTSVDVSAE